MLSMDESMKVMLEPGEVKVEAVDPTRSETESPIIRVCDSPESSSASGLGSPRSPPLQSLSNSFYRSGGDGGGSLSSPPPPALHPAVPAAAMPNPFLFRPFFNMPLPLLPFHHHHQQQQQQQQHSHPHQLQHQLQHLPLSGLTTTSPTSASSKPLPFSIDNILRSNFKSMAAQLADTKPVILPPSSAAAIKSTQQQQQPQPAKPKSSPPKPKESFLLCCNKRPSVGQSIRNVMLAPPRHNLLNM